MRAGLHVKELIDRRAVLAAMAGAGALAATSARAAPLPDWITGHGQAATPPPVDYLADMYPVTHGRGSDPQHDGWLKTFSNVPGSLASSRGAYRTSDYYWGSNGSSMRLAGLEADNSNADMRAIVVHGAWYAEPSLIATQGKLGRSEGCFVFGEELLPQILYKLGPGRLLYADKLSVAPASPPPFELPPVADNIIRTGATQGSMPTKAD